MTTLIRLALRNAVRNGRRTALTAATVTIGTGFAVVVLSLLGGLFTSMITDFSVSFGPIRVVQSEYAAREAVQPLHHNFAEVDPELERVRAIEGVDRAVPMIRSGVLVALGEELGDDAALLTGSSPEWYEQVLLPNATLAAGAWLAEQADDEQVVLGGRVARDLGAKVGDEILVMGRTQHGSMSPISADVVGILTGNNVIDAQAFVTLETARWVVDIPDGALEILVYPDSDDRDRIQAVSDAVQAELGDQVEARPWTKAPQWAAQLPFMDGFRVILSAILVSIMALAIFNTMTMSVLERTGEIGVMRAMGQSRLGAVLTFLTEAVVIGVLGGIAGAALGSIPALYLEKKGINYPQELMDDLGTGFAMSSNMTGDLTVDVLVIAVLCGIVTAALGAFFPALRAARIQPYEAMRQQR